MLFFKRNRTTIFQNSNLELQLQVVKLRRREDWDAVTKQSLSSAILQKELEDDLSEIEFGTLTTSCQTLEKKRWKENMEQDMDISPHQSPQKKVCRIHKNKGYKNCNMNDSKKNCQYRRKKGIK